VRAYTYFEENCEHTFHDIAKAIGEVRTTIGKLDNPEPTKLRNCQMSSFAESGFDAYLM
jgi:hypothetical protein